MSVVIAIVQREFLPPFVRGKRGVQNFMENLTKNVWSLGGSCPSTSEQIKSKPTCIVYM